VAEERARAEGVLRRLAEEYRDSVQLDVVLWEHEPVFAHTGYQQQIVRPSECDLVICILWSRLGTRLPEGFAAGSGESAPTGTEYEIRDALEAHRRAGKPNLLIYRKTVVPQLNMASAEAHERLRQLELLDDFCRRMFYDPQGDVIVAHTSYSDSREFERKLVKHLRRWLAIQVGEEAHPQSRRNRKLLAAGLTLVVGVLAVLLAGKVWISKRPAMGETAAPVASGAAPAAPVASPAFAPPPHSIAVLPFVNMSGDKEQEYFSDGLTEELLNSLSEINELQVAARTSAFSFKGKDTDIGTIARKLNVGAVLEGSVRRSANTVRITAQLINAVTGFHLRSKTYDRDLGDVLKLQTEIATAVADALKVTLLGDVAAKVELGGTRNPARPAPGTPCAKSRASRRLSGS
jgi:TolB-like protein